MANIIQSAISAIRNKASEMFNDNQGWFRGGQFTPVQQAKEQIGYQMQTSPVNRALYTGIQTVATPVVKSLANIGALGATGLGSAQMAFNRPDLAQKSFETALAARQFAGTEGSFDQGVKSGLTTLGRGGLSALQTALTGKGFKYVTPGNIAVTGLLGGGISKVTGGDFATGAGQAIGGLPQIMGAVGLSNPYLARMMPATGGIGGRVAGAVGNVAQGVGINLAQGTPITPQSVGIDIATGLIGGKGQFDVPNVKGMTNNVDPKEKDFVNNVLQRIKLGITPADHEVATQEFKTMAKTYGLDSYPGWKKLSLEKQANLLNDRMNEMASQWAGVKMGFAQDKRQALNNYVDSKIKITDPLNADPAEIQSANNAVEDIYNQLLKVKKDSDFLNKVKALRARFNEQRFKILGIDNPGNDKTAYAAYMQYKNNVPQSSLIDNLELKMSQLDEIIANKGKVPTQRLKIKPKEVGIPQTEVKAPTDLQTNLPPVVKQSISKIDQAKTGLNLETPPVTSTSGSLPRGFTESVQEAPNIAGQTKAGVTGMYTPKANDVLMGEAKALLESGATIDFKNTQGLDKKVAATIQEAVNQQNAGNHEAAANLFNNLSEHGTELGRSVQAFNLLQKMSPEAIALSAAGKIKKYNLANPRRPIPELNGDQVKIIAEKVQEIDLLKGREKNIALNELGNIVNSFIPSTLGDKALAVWKAGLLTSFRTHERNFLGNAIHGTMEVLKDIPATVADIALSGRTGQRTTTFTTRGIGEFGSKSTRQQMADIVSKGFDPSETIDKFDYKQITWGKNKIEQGLKKYTDVVFRTLGASDKPFYNASMARSLYDQAGAEAINAGRRGDMSFIEDLVKNPTEQMVKIAINDANVATFKTKNAASGVANAIKRQLGKNELSKIAGEVTLPFTGVPSSIAGQIINYSPVGLIKGIYKVGDVAVNKLPELQRQAVQELGRGVIGTGIFALGSYLMGKDIITGQPKDAEEARLWDSQNKPRNSILINGKWRSLNSIGPESVVFLAGAKLKEEMMNPEGSMANYAVGIGKDYLDQSFVQGLQAPVNALTDPARYGKSYAGQLISSPIPNIVKDVARGFDPYQRESNTVLDYAKSGIPGLRNQMVEKRDVLGNIMPQEPTGIMAGLDLFSSKTPISSPVVDELARLYAGGTGATPSKLTPSQTILKQKVKLTYEQLNNLEAGVGDMLRPRLDQLISDPNYSKLDDEQKAKIIDKVVSDTRDEYKNRNAGQFGVTPVGGYVDESGNFKTVDTTPIKPPELTGNATIDKKLLASYKTDVANQATNIAKSTQPTTPSDTKNIYSYIDENGAYKTVDLTPAKYPTLTGNTIVDKKLKSAYYSSINSQINDVIKLGQAGQITQEQMIKMVTDLNNQYSKGKGTKKIKIKKMKIKKLKSIKLKKPKSLKLSFKKTKPIKLKVPKLKKLKLA